jgi:hypothetical protein
VHWAAFTPRFHPSDFEVYTAVTESGRIGQFLTGTSNLTTSSWNWRCLSSARLGIRGVIRTVTPSDHTQWPGQFQ